MELRSQTLPITGSDLPGLLDLPPKYEEGQVNILASWWFSLSALPGLPAWATLREASKNFFHLFELVQHST